MEGRALQKEIRAQEREVQSVPERVRVSSDWYEGSVWEEEVGP